MMSENSILNNLPEGLNLDPEIKEGLSQLEDILDLNDEAFNFAQQRITNELKEKFSEPEAVEELKSIIQKSGGTVEQFIYSLKDVENIIQETYVDLYPQDRINFLKKIIQIESNALLGELGDYKDVAIEFCRDNVTIPSYAHNTDSGLDVFALEDYVIAPGETALIPTGFKVAIPNGYELQVRPKSGRSLNTKLRIANTPGTIDAAYRSEVGIIVENINDRVVGIKVDKTEDGVVTNVTPIKGEDCIIAKDKAFAQLVLCQVSKVKWTPCEDITSIGENRGGGFGSTNR